MTQHSRSSLLPLLICSALFLFIECQPLLEEDNLIERCLQSNHIGLEEYEALLNQTSSEEDVDNVDENFKCFLHCMLRDAQLLDSQGFLDADKFVAAESLSENDLEIIQDCKRINDVEPDSCNYAFNIATCIYENLNYDPEAEE